MVGRSSDSPGSTVRVVLPSSFGFQSAIGPIHMQDQMMISSRFQHVKGRIAATLVPLAPTMQVRTLDEERSFFA